MPTRLYLRACLLAATLIALAAVGWAQSGAVRIDRAMQKWRQRDLPGAGAELTQAIEQEPELTPAWLFRAQVRTAMDDFDGGIADCDAVLAREPDNATAYLRRGYVKQAKGEVDAALADFTRAAELAPNAPPPLDAIAALRRIKGEFDEAFFDYCVAIDLEPQRGQRYGWRAIVSLDRGQVSAAMADYDRAVELDPGNYATYVMRGLAYFRLRDWSGALHDYLKAGELGGDLVDYPRLYVWMIRVRLGDRAGADRELAAFADKRGRTPDKPWFEKIGAFMLGRVTEEQLLQAAISPLPNRDRDQHCEAWFYAGMKRLFAGERAIAADYFRRCVATDVRGFVEYDLAKVELKWLK
jgi:lipoprotein NlpI